MTRALLVRLHQGELIKPVDYDMMPSTNTGQETNG